MPPRKKQSSKMRRKLRERSSSTLAANGRGGPAGADVRIPLSHRDKLAGKWFEKLVALQARLRAANGCPWDREQTHESLRKYLIEETYEVLDAMETGHAREFSGELGDLLLQIIFHSILAEEAGDFTIIDVIESVHTKMVRRHPHVFGDTKAATSSEVLKNWERIKASERTEANGEKKKSPQDTNKTTDGILADVPRSFPAVLEAYQLTRRASRIGFDWPDISGILDKLDEEKGELQFLIAADATDSAHGKQKADSRIEEEVGDLLFAGVNIARFLGIDPEIALKKANRKFRERFNYMEEAASAEGKPFADLSRERKEEMWNRSKMAERDKYSRAKKPAAARNAR
ncbi:MAG: nucleoside triphosphate pyrophosphohydrolase [Candidatus Acidiferrales bacterium]